MKSINKTTFFLLLTFLLSFLSAGIYKVFAGQGPGDFGFMFFGAFYMFIPAISVVITEKLIYKQNIKNNLLISFKINKWFFIAWLIMPLIIFATVGINILFPGVEYNPEMTGFFDRMSGVLSPEEIGQMQQSMNELPFSVLWLTLIQGLIAGITINALFAFGEELGWRGFLLRSYQGITLLKASIVIGFIWGIWHAPLILMGHNYPQHPQAGVFMMIVFCLLLTPYHLYITIKSKSVIAAAIMHGSLNATAGISIMAISGGNDLTSGISGLAGFVTLAIFLMMLFIYDRYISKERIFTNRMGYYV
jgi:uncharacterized protein